MRRTAVRLVHRLRRMTAAVPVSPAPPLRWAQALEAGGVTADDWLTRRQASPRLYIGKPGESVARLRVDYPALTDATIAAADRVLRHEFDLLGSGPYTPCDPDRAAAADGY